MGARRLGLVMVACFCGFACVLGVGVVPAMAGATQIGEWGPYAGQIEGIGGLAVDNAPSSSPYGDVYVGDYENNRIDRFDGSGAFQLAWGWGVANGANELQTCTTSCSASTESRPSSATSPMNTGGIYEPEGIAVDNDPLSSSFGDVYVAESQAFRMEKFGPSGEFISMFGGDVNETTGADRVSRGRKMQARYRRSSQWPDLQYLRVRCWYWSGRQGLCR